MKLLWMVVLFVPVVGQPLKMARKPEDAGFSSERVERLRQAMKLDVEQKRTPGSVLMVARNGQVAISEAFGMQDRKAGKPMGRDAIFRIASMTKPVVSVAAMILSEEGKLDLAAPVAQYLPEFAGVKVGVERAAPKRAMTVHDLLRHTSGLTYGLFGNSEVDALYRNSGMFLAKSLAEMVAAIAKLPLAHQPGEVWEYSVSTDVLGRVVEVASGMELDQFIGERITGPLKMKDTAFYLTAEQAGRLAAADVPMMMGGDATRKPAILSGGGGLMSTAGDYLRFCQMLLNGGELEGVRILSPKTVALMTSDQLPPSTERHSPLALQLGPLGPTPEAGTTFGLGFAVRTDAGRNSMPGSAGDYSWSGITGTYFWVDPKEKMAVVRMVQLPQEAIFTSMRRTRALVYQALVN